MPMPDEKAIYNEKDFAGMTLGQLTPVQREARRRNIVRLAMEILNRDHPDLVRRVNSEAGLAKLLLDSHEEHMAAQTALGTEQEQKRAQERPEPNK